MELSYTAIYDRGTVFCCYKMAAHSFGSRLGTLQSDLRQQWERKGANVCRRLQEGVNPAAMVRAEHYSPFSEPSGFFLPEKRGLRRPSMEQKVR